MTLGDRGTQPHLYFWNCYSLFEGANQARVHNLEEAGQILDVFQTYGHNEIDTAIVYGGRSSERFLARARHHHGYQVLTTH